MRVVPVLRMSLSDAGSLDFVRVRDTCSAAQRREEADRELEGVVQRQDGQKLFLFGKTGPIKDVAHVGDEIGMAENNCRGFPESAAGEQQRSRPIARGRSWGRNILEFSSGPRQGNERRDQRQDRRFGDRAGQLGRVCTCLATDEKDARPDEAGGLGNLWGRQLRVERDGDQARPLESDVGNAPLRSALRQSTTRSPVPKWNRVRAVSSWAAASRNCR